MVLGVPILKHFRVSQSESKQELIQINNIILGKESGGIY